MSLRRLLLAASLSLNLLSSSASAAEAFDEAGARLSAQRGLNFLSHSTAQWQKANNCYGCHVQAVTLEALSVGVHHQYVIPRQEFTSIRDGILKLGGGARDPKGFSLKDSGSYPITSKTFGGLAVARFDQYVDAAMRDDLFKVARQLLEYQGPDGSVHGDHESHPVTAGALQATYQAMQTWRQAYARSADDMWLTPIRKAERYVQTTAAGWEDKTAGIYLQNVNYALLALVAGGVSGTEELPRKLVAHLVAKQQQDGGWGFDGGGSDAFATGQTVYALRAAGLGEEHGAVSRGITWLVKHQQESGGWGAAGSGKAEAMWGVLGLVSVDVLTVSLGGVKDGVHVAPRHAITVDARDNQKGEISRLELFVDDLPVKSEKAGKLSFGWETAGLAPGKHVVEAVATNAKGQKSRRRIEVFAGDVYLTEVGTRFEQGVTHVAVRDIAAADAQGKVNLRVFAVDARTGKPVGQKPLFTSSVPSAQGALTFQWDGKAEGKPQPKGRYLAELAFTDAQGKVLQTETSLFFHDTVEAQKEQYGEVGGQLMLPGAAAPAANAQIDLVDDAGRVVQSTRSNNEGNWRFKNVDGGKYKVRVSKKGFAADDASVSAARGEEAKAPMTLR